MRSVSTELAVALCVCLCVCLSRKSNTEAVDISRQVTESMQPDILEGFKSDVGRFVFRSV